MGCLRFGPVGRACVLACALGASGAADLACGGAPTKAGPAAARQAAARPARPAGTELASAPRLPLRAVAELPARDAAVYFARREDTGLLLCGAGGRWATARVPLAAAVGDATPALRIATGSPLWRDVAAAPARPSLGALRALGEGYLAAWVKSAPGNDELWAMALGEQGEAQAPPRALVRSQSPLRWVEVLPVGRGALLLWEAGGEAARSLSVAPWTPDGPSPASHPVAAAVSGWQAAVGPQGAAVALVTAGEAAGADAAAGGSVRLALLGADGAAGSPIVVSAEPTARPDIQLAFFAGRWTLGWTDVRDLDPHVYVAAVDAGTGAVAVAPRPAIDPVGGQVLVGLTAGSGSARALLAWEAARAGPAAVRAIELATLGPDAAASEQRVVLEFHAADDVPHFAPDGSGFAALTLAPARLAAPSAGAPGVVVASPLPAGPGAIGPSYVRLDATLGVRAAEPVRLDPPGGVPESLRWLHCERGRCSAWARAGAAGGRQELALVELPVRPSRWQPAARSFPPERPPLATRMSVLAEVPGWIPALAAAPLGDPEARSLVAWLQQPDRAAPAAGAATASYRLVSARGPVGPAYTLSERAIALGGISAVAAADAALAAPGAPRRGPARPAAVVAWAGPQHGDPQVLLTAIGDDGTKLRQRALTIIQRPNRPPSPPSLVSDVDLATNGRAGYIVAWVDTRDGNAEIYVAKTDLALAKIGPDHRVTSAPGARAEVRVAVRAGRVYLAWSDARAEPDAGMADIYLAVLDAARLSKLGEERALHRSPAHSRTPGLAPVDGGLLAWWIEGESAKGPGGPASLWTTRLGEAGEPLGPARPVAPDPAAGVAAAAVRCPANGCRGLLGGAQGTGLALRAFDFAFGAPAAAPTAVKQIATLPGAALQDVSLAAADTGAGSFVFADNAAGRGRIRRLDIRW
ncbi:MAG: hypothetical protein HY744_31040 [Deltaproteobacteria bacterium]|nr:hypothetical protein [Deltaproteobacteria bacterium]